MFRELSRSAVLCAALLTCLNAYAEPPEPGNLVTTVDTLSQLGYRKSLELQGSESELVLGFGSRLDEIVESGSLRMKMVVSPALVAVLSHLKVHLNNELLDKAYKAKIRKYYLSIEDVELCSEDELILQPTSGI